MEDKIDEYDEGNGCIFDLIRLLINDELWFLRLIKLYCQKAYFN